MELEKVQKHGEDENMQEDNTTNEWRKGKVRRLPCVCHVCNN